MRFQIITAVLLLMFAAITARASEVMLCQQQELKINKKSITSKKMDGGKQVYLVDGKVATPVEATRTLMNEGERKQ